MGRSNRYDNFIVISKKLYKQLIKKNLTISFAESMTGGSLTYELIKNKGSSQVIKGSIVAYSDEMKVKLLGLKNQDIDENTVVSEHVAIKMAQQIRKQANSNIGVGITGNAGPSKQEGTANLEVWIAVDSQAKTNTFQLEFKNLTRLQAIKKTVLFTYEKIYDSIV
jgi:PncC family amidohydrolase